MKDHINKKVAACTKFLEVKAIIDDYMDYYNNRRYQWELAKLAPNEFYQFYTTGIYPLEISNKPETPVPSKSAGELGAEMKSRDSTLDASASGQPLTE